MLKTYTHVLHGSSPTIAYDEHRESLIAVSGRILAIGSQQAIHIYDINNVTPTCTDPGSESCKISFISSFPVIDIDDSINIRGICFLRGGLLAVEGVGHKGTST